MSGSHEGLVAWERLFWTVFEGSRNPIALLDEHRVYVAVNPAVCELFGAPQGDLVGSPVDRFLAPQERSRLDADWAEIWRTNDFRAVRTAVLTDGSRIRLDFAARTAEIAGRRVAVVVWLEAEREQEPAPSARLGELTPREREVIFLVALGLTTPEIAERLVVSPATVKTHAQNAMAKLGARTRAHLVAIALADRQIVEENDHKRPELGSHPSHTHRHRLEPADRVGRAATIRADGGLDSPACSEREPRR